jgi:hypothetical protein
MKGFHSHRFYMRRLRRGVYVAARPDEYNHAALSKAMAAIDCDLSRKKLRVGQLFDGK